MPFILSKTVTYVSSLPVTYLTSLYTLLVRMAADHNRTLSGRPTPQGGLSCPCGAIHLLAAPTAFDGRYSAGVGRPLAAAELLPGKNALSRRGQAPALRFLMAAIWWA